MTINGFIKVVTSQMITQSNACSVLSILVGFSYFWDFLPMFASQFKPLPLVLVAVLFSDNLLATQPEHTLI